MSDSDLEWGIRIKEARNITGISQSDLAGKLGISLTTINRIEKGKSVPDVQTILNIASILDVDLNWLLMGGEGDSEPKGQSYPVFLASDLLCGKREHETSEPRIRFPGLPDSCFLYKTNELAMQPRIQPEDYVVVVKEEAKLGDTVLFKTQEGLLLIRKLAEINNEKKFIAESPGFPPILYTGKEKIFGKVLEGIRKYCI